MREMVARGLVDPGEAKAQFEAIEPELYRFPAIDPPSFRRAVEDAFPTDLPGSRPAGLRPELVPSVEVLKVLPTVGDPAVLELEDDAVANLQLLAVSLPGAGRMPTTRPSSSSAMCRNVARKVPSVYPVLAGQRRQGSRRDPPGRRKRSRAPACAMRRSRQKSDQRVHVGRVESLVGETDDRCVLSCCHRSSLSLRLARARRYSLRPNPLSYLRDGAPRIRRRG